MSYSYLSDNGICRYLVFYFIISLFKTFPACFIAIYLFLQLLRFEFNSIIKPIEKFQDDILYSFSILQSSGLNGIKYEH